MATSVSRKIKFTHVPKDGKTPVFETKTNQWVYKDDVSAVQMQNSADRLMAMEEASADALRKANTAKQTAEEKATVEEAVSGVRDSLFYITRKEGGSSGATFWNAAKLELLEDEQENWVFRVHARRGTSTLDATEYTLDVAYVPLSEYQELLMRVLVLERKLGIS